MIKDFSFLHLSTGDVLRKHVREGTKVGKTAQSYMVKGAWVRVRGRRGWVLVGYCCGCSRPVGRSTMSFNCVPNANRTESGALVPDEVMVNLVVEELAAQKGGVPRLLLDG